MKKTTAKKTREISKVTGKPKRKYVRRTTAKSGKLTESPDLMGALGKAQRKVQGRTYTAKEIADSIDAEVKKLQSISDLLRG